MTLRTAEGEKLEVISKLKVDNPNYKKPKIVLYNWITGEQINHGNGRFLYRYELKSETGRNSLQLYVNHFIKGEPLIPDSLILADDINLTRRLVSGID